MSLEPRFTDEFTIRNTLPQDPRKNLYDENLHLRNPQLPVKREISRNHLNKFEDFIAGVCDDIYSNLVEYRQDKRKQLD